MDQVFAPWRIEWVERDERNPDVERCVFCELPERDDDRTSRILARADEAFVLLNNAPYNPGHAMVVPHVHEGDYAALPDDVLLGHARLKQRTVRAVEAAMEPDGFNAGLNLGRGAGGSIGDHLHTHVVPRWEGDTNFMPVLSDTKVIVEALDDTWERVRDAFAAQEGVADKGADSAPRVVGEP